MTTNAEQLRAQAVLALDEAVALSLESSAARSRGDIATAQQLNAQAQQKLAQGQSLNKQADLAENSGGTASSGQVTAQEQAGKANDAVVQNPPTEGRVFRDTGATAPPADTGTNAPVRTTTQTQSTPAPDPNSTTPTPPQNAGVGARGEDTTNNTNQTQRLVNNTFSETIVPQPNVLDQFSSYTYSISWYLLTQEQFNAMARDGSKNVNEWKLLMQSGGAAPGQRDQQFPVDFYLDNLEIQTEIAMQGTGAAHNAVKIEFTVTEPAGITLIERLYRAVKTVNPQNPNYAAQPHCLVIEFYAYDSNGTLINPAKGSIAGSPPAVIKKFYPIEVIKITFRNANKLTEYRVTTAPQALFYQTGEVRASIPYPFELVGETLEQLLVGQPNSASAPTEGRDASTKPEPPPRGFTGQANEQVGGGTISSLGLGA